MSRAKPLPADERRRHILEAAVPLVLDQGADVTTREIAEAAGLAEGTLFRIFANKNELMRALIDHITDPEPLIDQLDEIDRSLDLTRRIIAILELLEMRHSDMRRVFGALHSLGRHQAPPVDQEAHDKTRSEREAALLEAITSVFATDAAALRTPPIEAAIAIRSMALAMIFPPGLHSSTLTATRVADILVHGIVVSAPDSTVTEDH